MSTTTPRRYTKRGAVIPLRTTPEPAGRLLRGTLNEWEWEVLLQFVEKMVELQPSGTIRDTAAMLRKQLAHPSAQVAP